MDPVVLAALSDEIDRTHRRLDAIEARLPILPEPQTVIDLRSPART